MTLAPLSHRAALSRHGEALRVHGASDLLVGCRNSPKFVISVGVARWPIARPERPDRPLETDGWLLHNLEVLSVSMTDRSELGAEVRMGLAVVRPLDAPRRLNTTQEREDFEQELVDQFLLAAVGAGAGDGTVLENRSVIFEFARFDLFGLSIGSAVRYASIIDRAVRPAVVS